MPVLKQGSSGPNVQDLQQKLKDLGFDPKGVDGNFGPGTRAAVAGFQKSKGLSADGVVGPATIAALAAAVGATGAAIVGGAVAAGAAIVGGAVAAVAANVVGAASGAATAPGLNLAALTGK